MKAEPVRPTHHNDLSWPFAAAKPMVATRSGRGDAAVIDEPVVKDVKPKSRRTSTVAPPAAEDPAGKRSRKTTKAIEEEPVEQEQQQQQRRRAGDAK